MMVTSAEIEDYVSQVASRFQPRRVILFGSRAHGQPSVDSDVDLLVVMPDGGDPLGKAMEIRTEIDNRFPLDLIVRDPDILQWRLEHEDWFLREIMDKGRVLYEAPDA